MSKPKEYKFSTLEEILLVINRKNVDVFLNDFRQWICFKIALEETKSALGDKVKIDSKPILHWIDDGKNEAHYKFEFPTK